jgi:hypothetical protein
LHRFHFKPFFAVKFPKGKFRNNQYWGAGKKDCQYYKGAKRQRRGGNYCFWAQSHINLIIYHFIEEKDTGPAGNAAFTLKRLRRNACAKALDQCGKKQYSYKKYC